MFIKKSMLFHALIISLFLMFLKSFQRCPIFGDGGETYLLFGELYMRIFMMMLIIAPIQPLTGQFFTSIGRTGRGLLTSLSRQEYFLIPLLFILPHFLEIDGVLYAAPAADVLAAGMSFILAIGEMHRLSN
jgi:Na+-driven multidrug efflux pump